MLFRSIAASALLSGAALAAPTVYPNVPVTFNAAAGVSYTVVVVANNVAVPTYNDLSITSISMEGRASFVCTAYGIDGSVTQLVANQVRRKSSLSCSCSHRLNKTSYFKSTSLY